MILSNNQRLVVGDSSFQGSRSVSSSKSKKIDQKTSIEAYLGLKSIPSTRQVEHEDAKPL
jgi:hypothetical protein